MARDWTRAPVPPSLGACAICGEPVTEGDAAEMHDADRLEDPELWSEAESGLVHPQCGISAGWKVS